MKNRIVNITLISLLLCNIFFTQIAANFLHQHQQNTSSEFSNSGEHAEKAIHKLSETCKICSLDLIHELFHHEISLPGSNIPVISIDYFFHESSLHKVNICLPGRAPPFLLI